MRFTAKTFNQKFYRALLNNRTLNIFIRRAVL